MIASHLSHDLRRRGVRFMVGRDFNGRWVVCDHDGQVGGVFSDRASAVNFAMFESDHMPDDVPLTLEKTKQVDARTDGPGKRSA